MLINEISKAEESKFFLIWVQKISLLDIWNFDELYKCIKIDNLKKLILHAVSFISEVDDLFYSDREIDKYWWDCEMLRDFHNSKLSVPEALVIDTSSLFNLYISLKEIESVYHYSLGGVVQSVRSNINILIRLLVTLDKPSKKYSLIKDLLRLGFERPYILQSMTAEIKSHPEIIPYLLEDDRFAGIGMTILLELQLSRNILKGYDIAEQSIEKEKYVSEFWLDGLKTIIEYASTDPNYELNKIIVQVFKPLLKKIVSIGYTRSVDLKIQEVLIERYQEGIKLFETYRLDYSDADTNLQVTPLNKLINDNGNILELM